MLIYYLDIGRVLIVLCLSCCHMHMYRNFKKKHIGELLKQKFWNIASAITVEFHAAALEELREFD